jgi:hypothetical protein
MTVEQLMKRLKDFDADTVIVMASDGEANSVSPMWNITEEYYAKENSYSGELIHKNDVDEFDTKTVVCFWPTN